MALVKRPGSVEGRLEPLEPSPAAHPKHLIDLTSGGIEIMAQQQAKESGTYKVGSDFFRFRQGDKLPDGTEFVEADRVTRFVDREEIETRAAADALAKAEAEKEAAAKAQPNAPENKAQAPPDNKAEKKPDDK